MPNYVFSDASNLAGGEERRWDLGMCGEGRQLGGPGRAAGEVWGQSPSPGLWLEHGDGTQGWAGAKGSKAGGETSLSSACRVTRASPVLVAQPGWEAGWPPSVSARDKDIWCDLVKIPGWWWGQGSS